MPLPSFHPLLLESGNVELDQKGRAVRHGDELGSTPRIAERLETMEAT
jgi:hypothetical protein